jgi:hypothetical protein
MLAVDGALCAFGCGRVAIKRCNNGKVVCAEFIAQCPAVREKNSEALRGRNPFLDRPHPRGMAGKAAWNRAMTWEQMYGPEGANRQRQVINLAVRRVHEILRSSPEIEARRRQKLSAQARRRGLGQYRKGSGRGKKGRYRGVWCDSSYELAFVIYALDEGLAFERNWVTFPYTFEGRMRNWIPDFRLTDGTYLEIKGYTSPQTEAKFAAFPHGLIVVRRENMQFVFEYVISKYGRDFIRLYE